MEVHTTDRRRRASDDGALFAAFDQLSDAIFVHDAETGVVLHVNQRAVDLYGFSPAEALSLPVDRFSLGEPPYSQAEAAVWLQRAAQGERPVFEWHARHRGGRLFWVEVSLNRVVLASATRIVAIVRDITDRRAQARALQESEARLRTIFETANAAIFIADRAGRLQVVNRRLAEMFHASEAAMCELHYPQLIHRDHRPDAERLYRDLMEGSRETSDVERHYQRVDGTDFWGMISGRRIAGPENRAAGLIGIIIDVSERRRMEAALRESEERFAFMVANASDIFCLISADLRLRYVSPVAQALTGFTPDELLGPVETTVHPDDWPQVRAAWSALFAGDVDLRLEYRHLHRRQGYVWVEALARRPVVRGAIIDAVAVSVRDVGARKAFEEELRRARMAAESATQAKSAFLANMSHEIRTPMNAVLGLAHLLEQSGLVPRQKDYLAGLKASARALQSTVNDILDFSKIEAGRLDLEQRPFDLDELLEELACVVGVAVGGKSIEVTFDVADDVPRALVGDALRLEQVLSNLCNNAIKFTERGEVCLRIAGARDAAPAGRVRLDFSVTDSGIGIERAVCAQLFQPFSQLDASTTRRFGGTGLGLAISRRLINLMDGEIAVDSTVGHGSRFSFDAVLNLDGGDARSPERPLAGRIIALIEPHPATRAVLAAMLARLGATVRSVGLPAECGNQCLGADVVLVDEMSWSHYRQCAAKRISPAPALVMLAPGRHEPLVNARGDEATPDNATDAPPPTPDAEGFLLKPVTLPPLREQLLTLLAVTSDAAAGAPEHSALPLAGVSLLVVDDSPIGQMVAKELLESFGATVDVAADGPAAIAAVAARRERPFDLVLMDLQMPGMDGFDTARQLRAAEAATGARRLPILALSANALSGTAGECLAAGMDGYIAKPVEPDTLRDVVIGHLGATVAAAAAAAPERPSPANELPGIDLAEALLRVNGDRALLQRFLVLFCAHYRDIPDAIRTALNRGDAEAAGQRVHDLVGVASTLGAQRLTQAARQLQRALRAGNGGEGLLVEFDAAFAEVLATAIREGAAASPTGAH